ncbi:helix-turn-helix domain-containing protein [Enterococcus sp. C1(2024)]|uniref:helix-turn-helix domain-containing protein n=1 Tax=Enterococcus TaxID=1350 RepID=UPI0019E090D8|nr:helix-turn-helix transcriptional regulator [Enterococcus faecalis]EGO8257123.1 helix-turn-helix transcriptional regulator [Enterococcus faecalis]EHH1613001.1 helix-turn-helix transcriptional regulator [Enterococcus faecalis]EIR3939700.1 helix-turn-helix transcriptional regulator [Enterococcus faecalis]EKN1411073.1 helix-turn-helix transcriptional regulator [Enterococcus faecalis]
MTVFERVKTLAKNRSKTMKQVTLDLGYSENYFYSLKSGKQPSAEKLKELADYFNVSVDYLLGRTENPHPVDKNQLTVEEALSSVMSSDGKPLTENDREILSGIIEAYLEKKNK